MDLSRFLRSYVGILLAPPGPIDTPTIGLIGGLAEDVLVHQAVGLLAAEVDFAMHQNGKLLWQYLAAYGEPLLDDPRPAVI